MKKKVLNFTKDEFISLLDILIKELQTNIPNLLNRTIEVVDGNDKIVRSYPISTFKSLKIKTDSDLFEVIKNAISKLRDLTIGIKSNIDKLPDVISSNTKNPNVALAIGVVSLDSIYVENLAVVIDFLLTKFYEEKPIDKDDKLYPDDVVEQFYTIVNVTKYLFFIDTDNLLYIFGKLPLPNEKNIAVSLSDTDYPKSLYLSLVGKLFNLSNQIKSFINLIFGFVNPFKSEVKTLDQTFIGNPFYHLGLLWVDFTLYRLERLENRRRLLELKLLEIKEKMRKSDDDTKDKYRKQIEFYEDKIRKLNMKIDKLKEVD